VIELPSIAVRIVASNLQLHKPRACLFSKSICAGAGLAVDVRVLIYVHRCRALSWDQGRGRLDVSLVERIGQASHFREDQSRLCNHRTKSRKKGVFVIRHTLRIPNIEPYQISKIVSRLGRFANMDHASSRAHNIGPAALFCASPQTSNFWYFRFSTILRHGVLLPETKGPSHLGQNSPQRLAARR